MGEHGPSAVTFLFASRLLVRGVQLGDSQNNLMLYRGAIDQRGLTTLLCGDTCSDRARNSFERSMLEIDPFERLLLPVVLLDDAQ